jgi:excinuclease UvrABC nuclease subunit
VFSLYKYENVASKYIEKVRALLASSSFRFEDNVPNKAGVYAVFNERNEVIYIGRTRNLRRRLLGNHRSGNIRGSQFRRALMQNYGLKDENEISNHIRQKCTFKFMEIEDPVERVRLEHFATAILAPTLNIKLKR